MHEFPKEFSFGKPMCEVCSSKPAIYRFTKIGGVIGDTCDTKKCVSVMRKRQEEDEKEQEE